MSVQDEHELRDRLSTLLDNVEPRPAPVMRTVRQGRGIRMRRWISVAAALAIAVAGAALIPGLLQTHPSVPMTRLHDKVRYKIFVTLGGFSGPHGVIASGLTDGRRWQVRLSGPHGNPTAIATGLPRMGLTATVAGGPASLEAESGDEGNRSEYLIAGSVNDRVTELVISPFDAAPIILTPVTWGGHQWVAVVLAPGTRIVRAVAYAGTRELAYSVPFGAVSLVTWWRPGQVPPQRLTRVIGAGRTNGIAWRYVAQIGPWGYCYTSGGNSYCDSAASARVSPTGSVVSSMSCGLLGGGNLSTGTLSGLVAAASDVRRVVLKYSDGSTATFTAAEADGNWFVGYAIPAHLHVVSSVEYGAAGHVVGHTGAKTWTCP